MYYMENAMGSMNYIKELGAIYLERQDFFIPLFFEHLRISFTALLIVVILGIGTGIVMSRNEPFAKSVLVIVSVMYTIPSIALLGIFVGITGIGETSALIVIVIYGLLPIVRSTYTGITEVDKDVKEVAVAMGTTPFQLLYKIELPLALPVIFSGIRTVAVMCIALTGIAAFIGAGGMGVAIWRGIATNNTQMTVLGSLFVAALASVTDIFLGMAEKYIIRYKKYQIEQ